MYLSLTLFTLNLSICVFSHASSLSILVCLFTILSGTFRWTERKDVLLLREVRMEQPFIYRTGSKEAGQKWTDIAANLNKHPDFQMSRDQRSVRERFNKLLQDFTSKINKEENASGISPAPPTEAEHILEEIKEVIASNVLAPKTNNKAEGERNKALKIRNQAMKTWGKENQKEDDEEVQEKPRRKRNRRSTADPLEYLASKRESEMELRKEELQLRKQQLELESKRQARMQEQMLFQQRQMQQQMQLMLALVQKNKKQ